jgi:glycosyltransferase involved in cell wall biosynthesis
MYQMLSLFHIKEKIKNRGMVTVIIPLYNKKSDVKAAINSIIEQTYSNWELIIIDDCSSDGSYEVVKNYISDLNRNIRLYKYNKNYGPYVLLNIGIQCSKGEYICRLDADDKLDKKTLELCVNILTENINIDIVHYKHVRENRSIYGGYGEIGLFYRKSLINNIGYYDSVRYAADTEFLLRVRKICKNRIYRLDNILYYASYRPNSLTTSGHTGLSHNTRKIYLTNLLKWHSQNNKLYIDFPLVKRPFDAPESMISKSIVLTLTVEQLPKEINQVHVSKSLNHFKMRFLSKYNLNDYNNNKDIAVFFGIYDIEDINKLVDHIGKKYILWGGTDCNYKYEARRKNMEKIARMPGILHLSSSDDIYERLLNFGICSKRIDIEMVNRDIFYPRKNKGKKIYIYNGYKKGNEELYGKEFYEQVIKSLPNFEYVFSNKLNCSYEDMPNIYAECFIGLRLTDHDGNANTVQEFEAMNIPIVHNHSIYGLKWNTSNDIVKHILACII